MQRLSKHNLRGVIALVLVCVLALLVKYLYFRTAERLVDIEELPLTPLKLAAGVPFGDEFSKTRLYTVTYITNAIFLWLFGFNVGSLKLTSFAFFVVASWGTLLTAYDWLADRPRWFKWMPFFLIALGPPVAQMWALKNRGGFIETWAALAWVLWLYGRWTRLPVSNLLLAVLGATCGLAIWAHPIALVFVVPSVIGVIFESFRVSLRNCLSSFLNICLAIGLGVMPLVALNFIFHFNTLHVIENGEFGVGANTPAARLARLFSQGFPRLAGLKQQWSGDWIFPDWMSIFIFSLLVILSTASIIKAFYFASREKRFTSQALAASVVVVLVAMNVFTSWGSFQGEPRRLLLLYVPIALLSTWMFSGSDLKKLSGSRLAVAFWVVWFSISLWSNIQYVSNNLHGYKSWAYYRYSAVSNFLSAMNLRSLYATTWVGAKLEFESGMAAHVSKNPYAQGGRVEKAAGDFSAGSAALFHNPEGGQLEGYARMKRDLTLLGVDCLGRAIGSFHLIYGCSKNFNIYSIQSRAKQVRAFSAEGVIFDNKIYEDGSFPGFYEKSTLYTWTRPRARLLFTSPASRSGFLCLRYWRTRGTLSGQVGLQLDDVPVVLDRVVEAKGGFFAASTKRVSVSEGRHTLQLNVPPFMPSRTGEHDLRALGIPVQRIDLVEDSSRCK